MAKQFCLFLFAFLSSDTSFLTGCAAEDVIYGNISVVLQNLEVNLFVLKGDSITRYVGPMAPKSPIIRPPCRTCDPSYNLFYIDNQYLIPNHSRVYVLSPNSVAPPTEVDIGNCNPVQLHSVKSNVVWVQCALQGRLMEIVELRRENNVTWYDHGYRNIRVYSTEVSRNGLLLVKEQDGEDITFLYYGDGAGRLIRNGLEDYSSVRYSKPSTPCKTIEELFFINNELILIQCLLRNTASEHGLILFNTSNPSQTLSIFHNFHTWSMKVHVFEDYVVVVSHDTIVMRNAVRFTGIEQLVPLSPHISSDGIFVRLKDTEYFVCTNQQEIYIIDIARVLAGNLTAYHVIESAEEICTDVTCSQMKYIGPLLFVPLRSNKLAMYTLDPIKLATVDILTDQYYRYFFTYTTLVMEPKSSVPVSNGTIEFVGETSSEPSKSSGLDAGPIAGIAVAAFVVILIVLIVTATLFCRNYLYKNRISRYYQYQTAEVRFENSQEEGIVIVPGRFSNPVWQFNDRNETTAEESSVPTLTLNNQSATNTKKKKNTNVDGGPTVAPNNVDYNIDYNDDDTGSYGFETRQEPVDKREYVDSLVIGTLT